MKTLLDLKTLFFLHDGIALNDELDFKELIKDPKNNKVKILVYENANSLEVLTLKFDLKDSNDKLYNFSFEFSKNLNIIGEYKNDFPKKIYIKVHLI